MADQWNKQIIYCKENRVYRKKDSVSFEDLASPLYIQLFFEF